MSDNLSILAAEAVSFYIDACGRLVDPTLAGLLDTEGANRDWQRMGYAWDEIKAALTDAWTANHLAA